MKIPGVFNPFLRTYTEHEENYFRFLGNNKLFEKFTKKEKSLFIPHMHMRVYQQNEVVFFRNDPSQALYIVKTGLVSLTLDVKDRFEKIMLINAYTSLGHNALLPDARRIYNAIVSSDTSQIYVIPKVNIDSIFERQPSIKSKMLEAMAEIFNENFNNLLVTYQATHGFFELEEIFRRSSFGC